MFRSEFGLELFVLLLVDAVDGGHHAVDSFIHELGVVLLMSSAGWEQAVLFEMAIIFFFLEVVCLFLAGFCFFSAIFPSE